MQDDATERRNRVGPVLHRGPVTSAVLDAIRAENADVELLDRGAYVRVLVPRRCVVTRAAVEARLGRPFRLPADLEPIMPAFKGRFRVSDDEGVWEVLSR